MLDNRLNPEARPEVEQHLESCEECRRELEALRWTKRFSRRRFAAESAPTKLEEIILRALELEDRDTRARTVLSRIWPRVWGRQRRAILAYGFVLVAGVILALSYFSLRASHQKAPEAPAKSESLPAAVAQDFRNYQAEKLPLMFQTGDVKEMEKFFSAGGIAFDTRVFDLGMMNYYLVGGRIHQLINRQSALFVYRGKDNQILICQMYPGLEPELPTQGVTLRENNEIRFYIYHVNGLTVVFWQEGAVTCVLASDIEPEEVVQLAFAKAVKD